MANQRFRGALNSASFPMVSTMQGRTIVQPQLDLNVPRRNQASNTTDASASDPSIPQILYCENVIPTGEGYMSCRFEEVLPGLSGSTVFDAVINLRDAAEHVAPYVAAGGLNYIFRADLHAWTSTNPDTSLAGLTITRAFVNGRSFVCFEGRGVYEYDSTLHTFTHQVFTGLTEADIMGIGSSSNYLLAYDTLTVFWSSLIDPLDFVPSLITGAGFAVPQDVRGPITALLGTNGGFILYTAVNAVAGVYSNNSRAPFNFKEVPNAGGVTTYEQISSEFSSGVQYAWSTNGLQKITLQTSEPVSAEINDFLTGRVYEEYDSITRRLLLKVSPATEFNVKIAYISGRYLVISYSVDGSGIFQYALIFDTTLKRWGKLKFDHVDCFAYRTPALSGDLSYDDLANIAYDDLVTTSYDDLHTGILTSPTSKRSIGFLGIDGTVSVLVADYAKPLKELGVIIFGKFQLVRARIFCLQTASFEGVYSESVTGLSEVTAIAMATLDGSNMDVIKEMKLLDATRLNQRYGSGVVGTNVSVAVLGTFALSSYLIEGTIEGSD